MTSLAEWECAWAWKRPWLGVTRRGTCGKGPLHVRMSVCAHVFHQRKRCRCRAKWRTRFKIVISVQKVRLFKNLNIYIFNLCIGYVHAKHMYGDLRTIYRSWFYSSTMLILGMKLRLVDLEASKCLNLLSYLSIIFRPVPPSDFLS